MAKINWTAEAEKWLHEIYDYIAADNPKAADREVRILLYGHYRIAYLIKPNRDIDILGVFHGALDSTRYLFNDT